MTHSIVKKAQEVLQSETNYPDIIVRDAKYIIEWSNNRREIIKRMWDNKNIIHTWQYFINISKKSSKLTKQREATALLTREVSRNDMNIFYEFRSVFRHLDNNALLFAMFDANLKLFNEKDISQIYKYLSCVNSKRFDDSLKSVEYLKWINWTAGSEILAYRLDRRV